MIFHKDNFRSVLDDDLANIVAKMANEILDKNSKVFFGTMYQSGSCVDFSTDQSRTDSHVCLAFGIELMGSLEPAKEAISLEKVTKEDLERAQAVRIKQLEKEVNTLRSR